MNDNMETTPAMPSNTPKRPRYLPPEPEKSGWLSKPSKAPKAPNPRNPEEPPALPAFSNSLFSHKGRLGRLSMQAANLALMLVTTLLIFVLIIIAVVVGVAGNLSSMTSNPLSIGLGLIGIPFIIMLVYAIIFQVRRLHDLNHSGWWVLLPIPFSIINMIATFTNIWGSSLISFVCGLVGGLFYLYLLLMPGTAGNNRYGAPRHTPTSEKVMGWIYIVLLTLLLLMGYKISKTFPIDHSHATDTNLTTASATTSTTANGKYNVTYPFTPQQLWENILKVTALPNGNLDQELIESSFGTTLKAETLPFVGKISQTHAGSDWYFSLKLMPMKMFGQNLEFFTFDWTDQAGTIGSTPPAGMCISLNDIKPSLVNQGWIEKPQDDNNRILSKLEFSKSSNSAVIIAYDESNQCLKQLTIMTPAK